MMSSTLWYLEEPCETLRGTFRKVPAQQIQGSQLFFPAPCGHSQKRWGSYKVGV